MEIIEFIAEDTTYDWIPGSKTYDSVKARGFVIMEYAEHMYFWIGTASDNLGKIFYFNSEICSSFDELIKRLDNDENVLK